jgi:DNA-binding MarR family transcriptional regulator
MAATDSVPNPLNQMTLDANGDGQLTVGDLPESVGAAFFLPGDIFLWALSTYATPLARLLEISPADYGGVLSGFVSTCVWLASYVGLAVTYHFVRDVDRRLTRATTQLFVTIALRLRIARALLLQRWRALIATRTPSNGVDFAKDLDLSASQLRALRLHAELSAGYALSVGEVARALGAHSRATQDLLDGLKELGLLNRTIGGADDQSAYTLTAAGRALLLFRQITPARHHEGSARRGRAIGA